MTVRVVLAGDAQPLARALRDAGVEVIYLGPVNPGPAVAVAVQEDADAIASDEQPDRIVELLAEQGVSDTAVLTLDTALAWATTPR